MTSREGAGPGWLPLTAAPTSDPRAEAGATPSDLSTAEGPAAAPMTPEVRLPVDLPMLLRDLEDAYIRAALARTQSNKKEAAKLLGMGRTTLVEKLRRRSLAASRTSQ
jgi:sigma-54 specific flagellar transcriptional regulator A